jgi:C4-dicarboxylate-specific signal transduction histidine kinase
MTGADDLKQGMYNFSVRVIACGVAITTIVFAFVAFSLRDTNHRFVEIHTDGMRIQWLAGEIMHLDEVLTMSARMAAATGDMQWESRYRSFEPQLDAVIKQAGEMIPQSHESAAAHQTDAANIRLVAMQNQSFALVRSGDHQAASRILFSEEYAAQKRLYAEGMKNYVAAMRLRAEESLATYRRRGELVGYAACIVMSALLASWVSVVMFARRHMIQRQRAEQALKVAHDGLEMRVAERTADLTVANTSLEREILERKRAEAERETLHQQLMDASRRAGMADVATGVLHNVGNVLNSVKVSAAIISERLRKSQVSGLLRAASLLREHASDLREFITGDEKGKQIPDYLLGLADALKEEQISMAREAESLTQNVGHIETIVSTQQAYARVSGVSELVSIADVLEDALRMGSEGFERHGIAVVREFVQMPPVTLDRQKMLLILINLLRNAKQAISAHNGAEKQVTVRTGFNDGRRLLVEVVDTGVGIAGENLTRIFSHGFTTRKDGHGFGLHSCALAATEMGGRLSAHSDGLGCGATFKLELSVRQQMEMAA